MHEHDQDLIMALAEGALDAAELAGAEASITACDECSDELAKQRLALDFFSDAPVVGLTEIESHRLHRDLRGELGLDVAVEPVVEARRINWSRWVAVSAAAAVLIGIVAVAPNLDLLGGADDAADVAAAPTTAAAVTTTVVSSGEIGAMQQPAETEERASDARDGVGEMADTSVLTTVAPAAGSDFVDPQDFDAEAYAYFTAPPSLLQLRQAVITEGAEPALTRSAIVRLAGTIETLDWELVQSCVTVGIDELGFPERAIALASGEFDDTDALFVAYVLDDVADTVVLAHDSETCAILGEAP